MGCEGQQVADSQQRDSVAGPRREIPPPTLASEEGLRTGEAGSL